jgi:hypothetical protein
MNSSVEECLVSESVKKVKHEQFRRGKPSVGIYKEGRTCTVLPNEVDGTLNLLYIGFYST